MGKFIAAVAISVFVGIVVIAPFFNNLYRTSPDYPTECQIECKTIQIYRGLREYSLSYYATDVEGKIYGITKEDWDSLNVSLCDF